LFKIIIFNDQNIKVQKILFQSDLLVKIIPRNYLKRQKKQEKRI
jgi:hypothetical protein